jgi:ribose transport system ATP-binding protein
VPVAAIVVLVLCVALEVVLRRTTWGVQLRATGSDPRHAHAIGIRVRWIQLSSYLGAGLLVFLASLLLMAQVGAGDPTAGTTYTLTSITAVVLGGASIFGGRGAFIGALVGAALIQQINTATSFLNINLAWQTYLLGILTLVAAGIYSKARDRRAAE